MEKIVQIVVDQSGTWLCVQAVQGNISSSHKVSMASLTKSAYLLCENELAHSETIICATDKHDSLAERNKLIHGRPAPAMQDQLRRSPNGLHRKHRLGQVQQRWHHILHQVCAVAELNCNKLIGCITDDYTAFDCCCNTCQDTCPWSLSPRQQQWNNTM